MGIYADLLANATAWDAGGADEISIGPDRVITQEIERLRDKGDVGYGTDYVERNEVQEIGACSGSVSDGLWIITFNLADGTTFDSELLIWNIDSVALQTAINSSCSGNITGWSNGDIVPSGGPFPNNTFTLTFSGNSVKGVNHDVCGLINSSLTGGDVTSVTETTAGQTDRPAMAVLNELGIVTTAPNQGEIIGLIANADREANPTLPRQVTLQALAKQASLDDDSEELYIELMKAFGLQDLL